MELEDEGRSGEESESESEYEEYTDSEDEMEPRLKPVFIRKWVDATVSSLLRGGGSPPWGESEGRSLHQQPLVSYVSWCRIRLWVEVVIRSDQSPWASSVRWQREAAHHSQRLCLLLEWCGSSSMGDAGKGRLLGLSPSLERAKAESGCGAGWGEVCEEPSSCAGSQKG